MTTSGRPAEQRADIDGQGNLIVQILGNDNRVDLGRAYLRLTRYLTRRRVYTEADLLSPYARSIPLVGRQRETAELRAWLESERPVSVRVLTGRAGEAAPPPDAGASPGGRRGFDPATPVVLLPLAAGGWRAAIGETRSRRRVRGSDPAFDRNLAERSWAVRLWRISAPLWPRGALEVHRLLQV